MAFKDVTVPRAAPVTAAPMTTPSSTADLVAKSQAMLAQTKAEGSTPFAGSSYDTSTQGKPSAALTALSIQNSPQPSPTVFSPKKAVDNINTVIVPAMNAGNAAIANQNTQNALNKKVEQLPGETRSAYEARLAGTNGTTPTPTPQPTDIPEAGQQWAYNQTTGEKIQHPINQPFAEGYSATPPANPVLRGHTVTSTPVQGLHGETYQQYSDGSYGKLDINGNFAGAVSANEFKNAQATDPENVAASISKSLASLARGAVPLSENQTAQINALDAQLSQDIAAQTQANQNYTGAMTILQNLYGMGNSASGIGMIKATVDAGVTAIANLQTKAAGAIAAMTDAFQKENYTEMRDHYKDLQAANDDIQAHIDNMKTQAERIKVDAQNEKHQIFQDAMTSKNFTLNQKKEAFDEYMQQANLDEKKKVDATDAYYKAEDLKLKQQATNPYEPGGAPPVQMKGTGKPSAAQQAQFLSHFPQNIQTQIRSLADYSMLPNSFPTRPAKGQLSRADAVALAKQYDPSYDESSAASRQVMQKNITSGNYSQTINAANTLVQHLKELQTYGAQLPPSAFSIINAGSNMFQKFGGSALQNNFKITADAVASEAAKIYKGTGGSPTEKEIQEWRNSISENMSPAQQQGAIKTMIDLMAGKLKTLSDQYQTVMGKPGDFQVLTDRNAQVLQSMGIDPSQVDPTYGNSPDAKVTAFHDASPNNAKAVDMIMKIAPGATQQDVIDQLNQAGYDI